jgi:hypothetical protein
MVKKLYSASPSKDDLIDSID